MSRPTHPEREPDYILGSDDEELHRLADQHRVWRDRALALWDRAGFAAGHTLLDAGCGPGYATMDLAQRVGPRGRVIAVDGSRRFLEHLESWIAATGARNVEPRHADVLDLELAPESLDGAWARWLLCYLRDPRAVVERIAGALRPGAALAVTDYFDYRAFRLAPPSAAMDRVIEAVQESWRRTGGDLDVQGHTPHWMAEAGLEVRHVAAVFEVARPGEAMWNWPRSFFRSFLPKLVAMGSITEDEARAFERDWDRRERMPGAFLCPPPMFDVIGVRPGGAAT